MDTKLRPTQEDKIHISYTSLKYGDMVSGYNIYNVLVQGTVIFIFEQPYFFDKRHIRIITKDGQWHRLLDSTLYLIR